MKEKVFSFGLNRHEDDKDGGEIVFGGVNRLRFKGTHTFVPVTKGEYWQVGYRRHSWENDLGLLLKCRLCSVRHGRCPYRRSSHR